MLNPNSDFGKPFSSFLGLLITAYIFYALTNKMFVTVKGA